MRPLEVDLGDDAAVRPDGVVVTVDTLVEGVHFRADASPRDLGFKALAVSVSDVLAMGARPDDAVLSLSLPHGPGAWVDAFADGLAEACRRYGVDLVGGDTTGSPGPRVITLTLLGRRIGVPWVRSGARPGDRLWVTGALGLAGAGWMLAEPPAGARQALARPEPPFAFARAVADEGLPVHAAMDLSDGLVHDAARMARASGVALHLVPTALPVAPELADHPDALACATAGGEDYQLLLAVAPADEGPLRALALAHGTRLTAIGTVTAGEGAHLGDGPWPHRGYDHFRQAST